MRSSACFNLQDRFRRPSGFQVEEAGDSSGRSIGASSTLLSVTSMARMFSVCASSLPTLTKSGAPKASVPDANVDAGPFKVTKALLKCVQNKKARDSSYFDKSPWRSALRRAKNEQRQDVPPREPDRLARGLCQKPTDCWLLGGRRVSVFRIQAQGRTTADRRQPFLRQAVLRGERPVHPP